MKYFTDLTDKTKADTIQMIYYEGSKLLAAQKGTFSSSNIIEQVKTSAWRLDPQLSLIRESSSNAVGDKYMIYQCGMYRNFKDNYSTLQLKVGAEFDWIFGYRVFKSLGDFTVEIQDGSSGKIRLIDSIKSSAEHLSAASLALAATLALAIL